MGDRFVFVVSAASLLLCAGCEQILGIHDPEPDTTGTGPGTGVPLDARTGGGVVMDAPSGSNPNACATLPSFGAVTKYSAANAIAFAIGDVDRDGKKDAVVVTRTMNSGDVLIYPGINGGGFGASHALRGTATLATGVLIADIDADGANDIVTWEGMSPVVGAQSTFSFSVHRQSTTAGTFLTPQTVTVTNLKGVVAGNLNNDTRTDLVVETFSPDETYPYFASTTTAGAYTKGTLIASGMTPSHVVDIDGDLLDDVAFTRQASGLAVYFNNAATPGTFTQAAVGAGSADNAIFGRFKSTTRMDLFLFGNGSPMPKEGVLYEQTAARVFTARSSTLDNIDVGNVTIPGGGSPIVDINADGKDDAVGMGRAEIQCPTAGTFWPSRTAQAEIKFGDSVAPNGLSLFTDINANGKPDFIMIDTSGSIAGNFLEVWLQ